MKRVIILSIAVLQCAAIQGCSEPQANPNPLPKAVVQTEQFAAVAKGRVDLEGGLIRLASAREGVIQQVLVEEGDQIKKGQLMAVIDDKSAQVNLFVAQREYQQAASAEPVLLLRLKSAE